jgi:hypothetical protein
VGFDRQLSIAQTFGQNRSSGAEEGINMEAWVSMSTDLKWLILRKFIMQIVLVVSCTSFSDHTFPTLISMASQGACADFGAVALIG